MSNYFEHPGISNSKLGWFKRSPAHYKYFCDHPSPEKEAYLIGGATHTVLFEPDKFKKDYHILKESERPVPDKDYRDALNKAWKKEILEAYSHKKIISESEYDMIMRMMEALHENDFAVELIKGCEFEKEVYWTDPETGLSCKKKVDGEHKKHRIDYKTADNADPNKWQRKVWSYDYYRQAGFYSLTDTSELLKEFFFIVQEKEPPYCVSIHKCTQQFIDYGKDEALHLMRKIKTHMTANLWPGYEQKVFKPELDVNAREQNYFDFDIPIWVIQNM